MRTGTKRAIGTGALVVAIVAGGTAFRLSQQLAPTAPGQPVLIKIKAGEGPAAVFRELESKGIVRDANLTMMWSKIRGTQPVIRPGTFSVAPGQTLAEISESLAKPILVTVRIPEGWWIARVAPLLEKAGVCKAADYIAETKKPDQFAEAVSFPLPQNTLEGYLFPDTYIFEPDTSAKDVIAKMLKTFQARMNAEKFPAEKLHKVVTVGSMIECEVAKPKERFIVSGIIENRLAKKIPLQIDATVLYALQKWMVLGPGIVNKVDSPYNTYRILGLPPGPIGSPGLGAMQAALAPQKTDSLYYVAMPDHTHLFASTMAGHIANIRKARAAARSAH